MIFFFRIYLVIIVCLPTVCFLLTSNRLNQCHLSKVSCRMLASTLQGIHSNLLSLDMSDNALQDEGVELLCDGLKDTHCKLETLGSVV